MSFLEFLFNLYRSIPTIIETDKPAKVAETILLNPALQHNSHVQRGRKRSKVLFRNGQKPPNKSSDPSSIVANVDMSGDTIKFTD